MRLTKPLLAVLLTLGAQCALAQQDYPNKPIRLIASYSPGSSVDIIARLIANSMSQQLGQQMIVENKAGAGGDIATDYVAKSPKDGYVLGIASPAPMTVNPILRKVMPFDPDRDIAPISLIAVGPNIILVNPSVPAKTLPELIAYIRANPGKVSYGSAGFGTSGHLAGELFRSLTNTDIQHIPYKGNSEAITDLMGGRTQMVFTGLPPVLSFVESGRLRAIAVADFKRTPSLPDLPTVAEAGLPGAESGAWYGIMAPAGTPPAILDKLNAELAKTLKKPEILAQLAKLGVEPAADTREAFAAMMVAERAKWKKLFAGRDVSID